MDNQTKELIDLQNYLTELSRKLVQLSLQKHHINHEIARTIENFETNAKLFNEEFQKASDNLNASTGIDTGTDINQ